MNIDVICPLYNAESYLYTLNDSILKQENINLNKIRYVLTRSSDNTEKILNDIKAEYEIIEPNQFSHSLTRENAARKSTADIIVFISQDIKIESRKWLYYLTKDIVAETCDAAYSRQIAEKNNIEKYTREKNYGDKSYIKTKLDIEKMGLNTFFFSDASSAIKREVFQKLNYYDGKLLPSNEDQYIAYKLIMAGYRIKYCSDSVVVHSHDFDFKSLYKRYQATGKFYRTEPYMNNYNTNGAGFSMALYIIKRIIEDRNWKAAIEFLPNMIARYLGMKIQF